MKKFYDFLTVIACLLAVSSCCVMRTTTVTQTVTPRTNDLIADLDVRSDKVSETFTTELSNKELVKLDDLKDNAVYEALKKIGADILVAPQYKITKEICNSTTVYTIVVSGYPAFYTNFRQMPMAEKVELRELKEGASYVVVKKSAGNSDIDYDKNIIVVPVKGGCQTLDMDDVTLDKVVLRGKHAKTESTYIDEEPVVRHRRTPIAQNDYVEDIPTAMTMMPKRNINVSRDVAAAESVKKTCKYTYKQCKDMEIAGITLTSVGIVLSCALCPGLLANGNRYYPRNYSCIAAGWSMLGIGVGSVIAGVPLWCVGGVNKKKVKNSNYAYNGLKGFNGVQLSLQGGNGIGLALSF